MKELVSVKLSLDARKSLAEATIAYHAQVGMIAEYLAARGVTKQSADMYRLGYVNEPLVGHEQYKGRLAIPYLTPTGPVDVRFRSIEDDGGPKYLSRPGAEGHLFGVNAFQVETDFIAICEGELDTIITHGECGVPAVGIPGSNGWKSWYWRAFQDYRKVFVLCDGDQAGRDLGKKIAQQLDVAVVVSMPDNMDVNEVFLSEGSDGIRKRLGL
jgi:DNA primase